eukprot:gnl/TRDRNA2_/TRDRNA2_88789_c0_seq1.p1 gnl/TRDRNA2_/TRDRNA2_88789_c0~~gnl/TRDRNA2_/TRDRNA2_88789_c0_seq1.p1  ORF type:complete len:447 (-),score=58.36 gnl/TRDRNA2_/TRDRNA2_88789_c0_seq1:240-1580(-)
MSFAEVKRRRLMSRSTELDTMQTNSAGVIIVSFMMVAAWLGSWWKERSLRRAVALLVGTQHTSLMELRRALRTSPVNGVSEPEVQAASTTGQVTSGSCSISVVNMAGETVWGPQAVESSAPVAEVQDKVAAVLNQPPFAVRLHYGSQQLSSTQSLADADVPDGALLNLVVCRERVEIADALFARAFGQIWVPEDQLLRAPFTGRRVAFFAATTIRLYDEWVTKTERVRVKAGRKCGTNGKDDDGSDSEYEEREISSWEAREEVTNRLTQVAQDIYIEDGSGQRALLVLRDMRAWAWENAVQTHENVEQARLGAGLALQAMMTNTRERGVREEEYCILAGETLELAGEACVTAAGLIFQEPRTPSPELHRIDTLENVAHGDVRPSSLPNKIFVGSVLRGPGSLADLKLRRAQRWRVGKWFAGMAVLLLQSLARIAAARRKKRQKQLG